MEKYGFVYIWFDRKHKRYYIGMHWGREDDGYICSSTWMKNAYKRRPEDFKRRILNRVYSNRKELYEKEKYWLSLIKEEELKVKYYNLSKTVADTWLNEESRLARNQKISIKTKEAMQRPEVREKYLKGIENRPLPSKETREKRKISMLGKNKGKITVKDKEGKIFHTTSEDPRWISGELTASSKGVKRSPISESHKLRIKEIGKFKELNNKKIKCLYCDFEGNPGNIGRYHNEKCKHKNQT